MESIVIQSTKENLVQVEAFLSDICDEYHVGNYFATISVAVMHAVQNAMEHGNKFDASKKVSIICGHCMGGVYFSIEDEGEGFDYIQYGDFPIEGRGEGIFLIKTLCDRMEYSDSGRQVRLEFAINGIESSDSLERRSLMKKFCSSKYVGV